MVLSLIFFLKDSEGCSNLWVLYVYIRNLTPLAFDSFPGVHNPTMTGFSSYEHDVSEYSLEKKCSEAYYYITLFNIYTVKEHDINNLKITDNGKN